MGEPEKYLVFRGRAEWRAWLEEHHAGAKEAWVVHGKKGAGTDLLVYEDGVEEALCFGWIDGRLRSLDAKSFLLRYSPRRRGSVWAASNKARAERLIREGRMTQAGLDRIDEARLSGEWDAADRRDDTDTMPPDLLTALRASSGDGEDLEDRFRCLPPSRRKMLLWWIMEAKKSETRARRVTAVVVELTGERGTRE